VVTFDEWKVDLAFVVHVRVYQPPPRTSAASQARPQRALELGNQEMSAGAPAIVAVRMTGIHKQLVGTLQFLSSLSSANPAPRATVTRSMSATKRQYVNRSKVGHEHSRMLIY
jgi:hypothetical protein